MSQKVQFYIKTDIIGSKIIFDDLPEDKVQSAIDKFITKNIEFFKKYQIKPIKEEGDGVLFEGDDLSTAIQACLELSKENQINPITVYAEDKSLAYRFALKMFIVTSIVNLDKPYDLLLSRLSVMEKAVQYPENSVILDKTTFELTAAHFKNNRIVYKFIEIDTDTGKDSVIHWILADSYVKLPIKIPLAVMALVKASFASCSPCRSPFIARSKKTSPLLVSAS